jgi:hypothetical protein
VKGMPGQGRGYEGGGQGRAEDGRGDAVKMVNGRAVVTMPGPLHTHLQLHQL